jgi:hypothetical protein
MPHYTASRPPATPIKTSALKNGSYRPTIRQDDAAGFLIYAEQFDLADELAIARPPAPPHDHRR